MTPAPAAQADKTEAAREQLPIIAWVVPGDPDPRGNDGWLDAKAWSEGEFSRPLCDAEKAATRIAALEAALSAPAAPVPVVPGEDALDTVKETYMSDSEVMAALRSDTPLNRARAAFSSGSARIEQAGQQSPIEMRRMEFEATQKIIEAFNSAQPPSLVHAEAAPEDVSRAINRVLDRIDSGEIILMDGSPMSERPSMDLLEFLASLEGLDADKERDTREK